MRFFGLTPWRIFLILWAAFCVMVTSALLGYRWAIVACHVTGYVAGVVGILAFVAVYALLGWEKLQERKRGDAR